MPFYVKFIWSVPSPFATLRIKPIQLLLAVGAIITVDPSDQRIDTSQKRSNVLFRVLMQALAALRRCFLGLA